MLMRRRMYFLLPDLASAQRTMSDLLLARIEERHIHFMARDEMDLEGLHEANLLQTSDIVHGAEAGLVIGGFCGLAVGAVAAFFPIVGTRPQWELMIVTAPLGALFGAWVSSMIGVSVPNSRLKAFRDPLERGMILLMVDVRESRVEEIREMLKEHHPEAHMEGIEAAIPAFP
ncbi:membrane protein [Pandoraea aquatica]|uniref:Membrane protein n=2 Tax=Pandoraea aquatica TaxID=2508290 RepID=A0A5E4UVL8_9BURK|nr:membrane protein [Pandoraea aquatica]